MKNRVTIDEIEQAKDVDLLSYLEGKGETFKKEGKYYRHAIHDSLIIKGNMYAWNSRNEKGYGCINFAKMYYNLSFPHAVQDINKGNYKIREHTHENDTIEPFVYPKEKEVSTTEDVERYLIHERKIDKQLTDWLLKKDYIAQDKRKNVVFKWKNHEGDIIGADLQGTIPIKGRSRSFKHIMPTDKIDNGFTVDVGKPSSIFYFESPIDMLSYWSIKQEKLKNVRLTSMNGLKDRTVVRNLADALNEGHTIDKIVLAVDNDKAGNEFINKMKQHFKNDFLDVDVPEKHKDWNLVLKDHKKKEKQSKSLTRKEVEKFKNVALSR